MKKIYFYCVTLSLLCCNTVSAQSPVPANTSQFHGAEFSKKNGALSKMALHPQEPLVPQKLPLSAALQLDKFGIKPTGQSQQRLANADYGFHGLSDRGINIPFASVNDTNGNIYITGTSSNSESAEGNFVTIKINAAGNKVWEKRKPGTLYAGEIGTNVLLDASANPIAAGVHWNGHDMDIRIIKYDAATGEIIWESTFGGNANGLDSPTAMTSDAAGNIIVTGITYTGTSVRFLTLKYAANGTLLWSVTDDNEVEGVWNEPSAVTVDASGNVAVAGYGANADYWQTYYTIKYDASGNALWKKSYTFQDISDPEDPESPLTDVNAYASAVAFDATGNCYVTGTFNTAWGYAGTIKYDSNGQQVWVGQYQAPGDHTQGYNIATDGTTVYVSGRHLGSWVDDGVFLLSYDASGSQNWVQVNNNLIDPRDAHMVLGDDHLPVVAGWGYDPDTSDNRIRIIKYAADGSILQEASYLRPFSSSTSLNEFIDFGLDDSNNIYVTMVCGYLEMGTVFETVKLAYGGTDVPVWNNIYSGNAIGNLGMLMAVNDGNNNTYVTGMSGDVVGEEYVTGFFVTKYNATGDIDWEKSFNPANGNGSNGIIIKTTATNELLVYLVPEGFGSQTLKLKKYDAAGNLIWEFEKPVVNANLYAFFTDDTGNIYLSGTAKENEADMNPVFATIKVSDTGTELWSDFATTGNAEDNIYAINAGKVTPEGDILLVGASGQGDFFSSEADIAILKYTADGTLSWMQNVEVAGHNSAAQDLLLDASGNIYINGVAQDADTFQEKTALVKTDAAGTAIWTSMHAETNRHSRSYTLRALSTGEIVVTGFSVIYGVNNKVIAMKFDTDGNELWTNETPLQHFFRDMYVDAADHVYVLSQLYLDAFPYRLYYGAGPFYAGQLMRIESAGAMDEEQFLGPELSTFNPVNFAALPDGRLLIPGELAHEMGVFQGHYFFESEYNLLGVDHPENPEVTSNWLGQNYPNPANGFTQIPFYSENGGKATIRLYDITGKYIREIASDNFAQGYNTVDLDVSGIQSGMYFYQIISGSFKQSKKIILN